MFHACCLPWGGFNSWLRNAEVHLVVLFLVSRVRLPVNSSSQFPCVILLFIIHIIALLFFFFLDIMKNVQMPGISVLNIVLLV